MHKCCLFCPYPPLAPSFSCPSLVSFMFPFLASSAKVSCHFVRHICIAVPRGKQWLEKRCGWKGKAKRQNKNKEVWPVNGRQGSITSHIIWHITQLFFIFIFFTLTEKNVHLNVQKPNTNTTICTAKCCHSEITVRVIHPRLHPCHWASLLLMASSFFLCSLYFPSDSAACFIVFCHVSVIAPTACLMLSISFFFWVCPNPVGVCMSPSVCTYMCVCGAIFPQQGRLWVCGAEPSCRRAPHGAKWQPAGHHWLMTVKTLAVNVKRATGCHSEALHLWAALTTAQQAPVQLDSAVLQQTSKEKAHNS